MHQARDDQGRLSGQSLREAGGACPARRDPGQTVREPAASHTGPLAKPAAAAPRFAPHSYQPRVDGLPHALAQHGDSARKSQNTTLGCHNIANEASSSPGWEGVQGATRMAPRTQDSDHLPHAQRRLRRACRHTHKKVTESGSKAGICVRAPPMVVHTW
jgi:hypothetical protein